MGNINSGIFQFTTFLFPTLLFFYQLHVLYLGLHLQQKSNSAMWQPVQVSVYLLHASAFCTNEMVNAKGE